MEGGEDKGGGGGANGDLGGGKPRPLILRWISRWISILTSRPCGLNVLLLSWCIICSILSISELVGRQRLVEDVQHAVEQFEKEKNSTTPNGSERRGFRLLHIKSRALELLANGGHTNNISIRAINSDLRYALTTPADPKSDEEELFPSPNGGSGVGSFLLYPFIVADEIQTMASYDFLWAIALISAASIGTLIGALRQDEEIAFRELGVGVGIGVVSFFGLLGGQQIFLLGATEQVHLNPHSGSLAALLMGLFSERAYELLSLLMDQGMSGVRSAFNLSRSRDGRVSSLQAPKVADKVESESESEEIDKAKPE